MCLKLIWIKSWLKNIGIFKHIYLEIGFHKKGWNKNKFKVCKWNCKIHTLIKRIS